MNALASLRSRIFIACALLAVLSIGAAVYVVSVRATTEAENALQSEILATRTLVEQIHLTRAETFAIRAKLVAADPKLKAAVDTNDPPTVQKVVNEYQDQFKSNFLVVTHRSGSVLASVGESSNAADAVAGQPAVRNAMAGRESVSIVPQPTGMLQLFTAPIEIGLINPEILGALSVGFLLDDALAAQLKATTGSEIAFAIDGHIVATTLPDEARPALARLALSGDRSQNVALGSAEFAALPLPMSADAVASSGSSGPVALVLRSRTEHLRFLRAIHTELAATAVAAVLLATLLSFVVARTITRPLADITGVMREVAATGDLTRKIVLHGSRRWDDEDARLMATTFNTLTDSVARFQREISQRERLSALGRLSTVIAHEVRNPLMIIKAALHTLRRPDVEPAALKEVAADIDEEVARLNRIVNEVLDFARPIRFELGPADINALCRESAAAAEVSPGVPVELDLDQSLGTMTTDAERLRVALINLVANARQAVEARADGTDPHVRLSTGAAPGRVTIVIADSGVGIDHADLPRVFDPFFTTKRGGTGLGLPIAKNIIEGLGGTIAVTSTPGRGTQMRLDFPLAANR